jgi:hypothetical protein
MISQRMFATSTYHSCASVLSRHLVCWCQSGEYTKKTIELKLHRVQHVVFVCFQLHNFCTNERDDERPVIFILDPDTFVLNYEFSVPPVRHYCL